MYVCMCVCVRVFYILSLHVPDARYLYICIYIYVNVCMYVCVSILHVMSW